MSDDLLPIDPPELWNHNGRLLYFGRGEAPPGYVRADSEARKIYAEEYKRRIRIREQQIRVAEDNLAAEVERNRSLRESWFSKAIAPEEERDQEELNSFDHRDRPAPESAEETTESPYTPGAKLKYFSPRSARVSRTPSPQDYRRKNAMRSKNSAPPYESVVMDLADDDEAEEVTLRIQRVSPNPEIVEEIQLLEHLGDLNTLGRVQAWCKERHSDGRMSIFRVFLLLDGEQIGPWRVTVPQDRVRLAQTQADEEAMIARIRAERGLPPLGAPAAPPAATKEPTPQAPPPGFVSVERLNEEVSRVILETIKAHGLGPAPAAAPSVPAPPPAPVPGYLTREDMKAYLEEIKETLAPKPPEKDPASILREAGEQAKTTLGTIRELAIAVDGEKPSPVDEDPTVDKNGVAIPKSLFKSDPKTALVLSNIPIVQAVIGGLADGIKDVMREGVKARREELELEEKELRLRERRAALARSGEPPSQDPSEGLVVTSPPVVSPWAPPRKRGTHAAS